MIPASGGARFGRANVRGAKGILLLRAVLGSTCVAIPAMDALRRAHGADTRPEKVPPMTVVPHTFAVGAGQ